MYYLQTCPYNSLKNVFRFDQLFTIYQVSSAELQWWNNYQDVPGSRIHEKNVLWSRANENDDSSSQTDANYVSGSGSDENQSCNSQSAI